MLLVVAALFAVGWMVYQPVYDLLMHRGEDASSSQPETQESLPSSSESDPSPSQPEEAVVLPQSAGSRMVYLPPEVLEGGELLAGRLEKLKASGMEGILIDLKNPDGWVLYQSGLAEAASSLEPRYDLAQVTAAARKAGLQVAGRLWAFQDKAAASLLYESCVKYNDTTFNWLDRDAEDGGKPWLNPYAPGAQQYLLDLMEEAMAAGVKNFVLEGVQFPSGISLSAANYGPEAEKTSRAEVLSDFMTKAEELAAQQGGMCWYAVRADELLMPGTDPLGIYGGAVATAVEGHRLLVDVTPANLTQEAARSLELDAQQQTDPVQVIAAQLERVSGRPVTPYLVLDDLSGGGAVSVLNQLSGQEAWQDCDGYIVSGRELLG